MTHLRLLALTVAVFAASFLGDVLADLIMKTTRAISKALRGIWWHLRANLCERLVTAAINVCPGGYTPSFVEAVVREALKESAGLGLQKGRN